MKKLILILGLMLICPIKPIELPPLCPNGNARQICTCNTEECSWVWVCL